MKKKILFVAHLIITLAISQKLLAQKFEISSRAKNYQKYCGDWMRDVEVIDGKNGKISTITTSKFYANIKDGKICRGDYCPQYGPLNYITKQEFDSSGKQIEKLKFDSLNNFIEGDYFQFDSIGFLKKHRSSVKYDLDWGNKRKLVNTETSEIFYYTDLGCVYLINKLNNDEKVVRKKEFSYDDKDEIKSASEFRLVKNTNRPQIKMKYLFKESHSMRFNFTQLETGYKISEYWRFLESPLQSYADVFSDTFGSSQFDGEELSDSIFKTEFLFKEVIVDTISNKVILLFFDPDKKNMGKSIIDSLDREIDTENIINDYTYSHSSTAYNGRNEEISVTNLDKFGNALKNGNKSFKYEYDKRGNWISKIEYVDNMPVYIYNRQIVYKK